MYDLPKISCITPFLENYNLNLCKRSIEYFIQQNYKNKELILLSQNTFLKKHVEPLIKDNIIILNVPKRLNLNEIYNLAIEIATGTIICQWDYDDHYHPYRLISQCKMLLNQQVIACFYNQFLNYHNKQIYVNNVRLSCSVMFRKHIFETFKGKLYSDENIVSKLDKLGITKDINIQYQYICSKDIGGTILNEKELDLSYYQLE